VEYSIIRAVIPIVAVVTSATISSAQILPGGGGAAAAGAGGPPALEQFFVSAVASAPFNGTRAEPYQSLHDALTNADPAKQTDIYIRGTSSPGYTYTPSQPSTPSIADRTFTLSNRVALIGGWDGGATGPIVVDPINNVVVLSGDQGTDNSYHVLTVPSTSTASQSVHGCTIRGGVADGPGDFTPVRYGGGLFNDGGTVAVTLCTFEDNEARKAGGGIYNAADGTVIVSDSTFDSNFADECGGAVANNDAFFDFTGSNRSGNGYVEIWNSTFRTNGMQDQLTTLYGGAVFSGSTSDQLRPQNETVIVFCDFDRNESLTAGGAYSTQAVEFLLPPINTIYSSRFYNNVCAGDGGAITVFKGVNQPGLVYPAQVDIVNSSFCTNIAGDEGGAVWIGDPTGGGDGPPTFLVAADIISCTMYQNDASQGGGLFVNLEGIGVHNTILWQNTPNQIWDAVTPDAVQVHYTDIQGGWAGPGSNNLNVDPMLESIGATCEVPLSATSPILNLADLTRIPLDALDIDNDNNTTERLPDLLLMTRVISGQADIGARERQ